MLFFSCSHPFAPSLPLFSFSPSLWLLLWFGTGTDTAAGDHLDNLLSSFSSSLLSSYPSPSSSASTTVSILFFPSPENNLLPGSSSSGRYFRNILTDNHFSFCSADLHKNRDIHTALSLSLFTLCNARRRRLLLLPSSLLPYDCKVSKTSTTVVRCGRITAIIPRKRTRAHVSSR